MDGSDNLIPPACLLTGGNAQLLVGDPSRRASTFNRRSDGQPRQQQRETPADGDPTHDVAGATTLPSNGFEILLARFDQLESSLKATNRRVDNIEAPRNSEPEITYFSDDVDLEGTRSPRDEWMADEGVPRTFIHGRHGRGGDIRNRRGALRAGFRHDDNYGQNDYNPIASCVRPDTRQRTSWDRPRDRYGGDIDRGFLEYRQPTVRGGCTPHGSPHGKDR